MTETEAIAVLEYMRQSGMHYQQRHEDDEAQFRRIWSDTLRSHQADVAIEAAELLVREDEWFPTPSRFLDRCHDVLRRRALSARSEPVPELPPAPSGRTAKEWLALAREAIHRPVTVPEAWGDTSRMPSCPSCGERDRVRIVAHPMGRYRCDRCRLVLAGTPDEWDDWRDRRGHVRRREGLAAEEVQQSAEPGF